MSPLIDTKTGKPVQWSPDQLNAVALRQVMGELPPHKARRLFGLMHGDSVEQAQYDKDYGTTSEADAGMCYLLALGTRDAGVIESLARTSPRYRDKWDSHKTYLSRTIQWALDKSEKEYRALGAPSEDEADAAGQLVAYSSWGIRELPDPEWLVDQLIPKRGMVLPVGRKGAAKTFWMIDIAMHIAGGMEWQGRKVQGGPMLYLYGEGTLKRRVQAWRSAHQIPDGEMVGEEFGWDVTYVPGTVNLLNDRSVYGFVDQVLAETELGPLPVGITLETLTRMAPGDENSPEWGGQVAKSCEFITRETGASVILPHHTPWSKGDQRPRGHTRLTDAADAVLLLEKKDKGAGPFTVTPQWLRESDDEFKIHLKLTPHDGTLVVDKGAPPAQTDVGTEDMEVLLAAELLPPQFELQELADHMVLSTGRARHRLVPLVKADKVRLARKGSRGKPALYTLVDPVPGRDSKAA